jgi:hypothetical protein
VDRRAYPGLGSHEIDYGVMTVLTSAAAGQVAPLGQSGMPHAGEHRSYLADNSGDVLSFYARSAAMTGMTTLHLNVRNRGYLERRLA